ncbi:hypothetical protein Theos_2262 (plasmid) [Thermus oshimai JL-2]|uniref:Uncharacterized protein n=1 Tax=Thermus oshimai JL-2 TaxID=751945 RepID=K7RLJ4_THEOS|nr:hypothetical protein [Thermus oshimai]AFV77252.1 hypothetical protein Theos_2262 [Thermus oshimai JL-2]
MQDGGPLDGDGQANGAVVDPVALLVPVPDFTLSLNPTSLTVQQGGTGTVELTLTPRNGFTGTVSLSLENAPAGVEVNPKQVSVTGASPVAQTITVSVPSSVEPNTYQVVLVGTLGFITRQVSLALVVQAPGGGGGGGGTAGTTWTWRSGPLFDVTYGNGLFVAVGGAILTSSDGVTWTRQSSGTSNDLYAVTYGGGLFVAVGGLGTILTSP